MLVGGATAAIELWIAASLLADGDRRLRVGRDGAAPRLALGLLLVMLFLGAALVAASVAAHVYTDVPPWVNASALAVLLGLGVGSYGLELRYVHAALPTASRGRVDEPEAGRPPRVRRADEGHRALQ